MKKKKKRVVKHSIDPAKGAARIITTYRYLKEEVNSYNECVKEFNRHFAQRSDSDPHTELVKYLGTQPRPAESQAETRC